MFSANRRMTARQAVPVSLRLRAWSNPRAVNVGRVGSAATTPPACCSSPRAAGIRPAKTVVGTALSRGCRVPHPVELARQAGFVPSRLVLVQDALADHAVHHGHRRLEGRQRRRLISGVHRRDHFLDVGAHPRAQTGVADATTFSLTRPFAGLRAVGQLWLLHLRVFGEDAHYAGCRSARQSQRPGRGQAFRAVSDSPGARTVSLARCRRRKDDLPRDFQTSAVFRPVASAAEYRFMLNADANHAARASCTCAIRAGPRSGDPCACYIRGCRRGAHGPRRGVRGVES